MKLELPGPWELPLAGMEILEVHFSYQLGLTAYRDATSATLVLEGAFELRERDGGAHWLDVSKQPWEDLSPVLSLRHDKISGATATSEADLRIELESGRSLSASAHPMYESWHLTGPGDVELIAPPGGGDPRYPRLASEAGPQA